MDEKKLIEQAKIGDFAAFTELINRHKVKVFSLVKKLAGNEQDAEDIMQDSLLKAVEGIDSFRGDSSFGTWLYVIALNEARAHFARQKQRSIKSIEELLPRHDNSGPDTMDSSRLYDWVDPHQKMESDEIRHVIDNAIAKLPYKFREAFILRYMEELPVKEVADLIGESDAATKSRILRARLALRDSLAHYFEVKNG
jgi:RNA polymerase sigma-70 factor (ECF subfamily)